MSIRPPDAELRARFEALRRADAEGAPPFAVLMARARAEAADVPAAGTWLGRSPGFRRLLYAGGLAAAAVVATILVVPPTRSSEAAFERAVREFQQGASLGEWQSPTASLLKVPGSELMSTVPSVGTVR